MLFNFFENDDSDGNQTEVIEADNTEDFGKTKILGGNSFPLSGQFDTGDDERQRGIFDQIDNFVPAAMYCPADCLGDNDPDNGLERGKAQSLATKILAAFNRQECTPHIFRLVGSAAKGETENCGNIGRQIDTDIGQAEIENKQLDNQRCPAKYCRIAISDCLEKFVAISTYGTGDNTDQDSAHRRRHDKGDGHDQSAVEAAKQFLVKERQFHD